jgi:organic radical activating enzyme
MHKKIVKSLEITTQIGCPMMCTFCPQDKLNKAYQHPQKKMTLETYSNVLNKLPLDVEIVFAGYTEPWANKLCNTFVELALNKGFHIQIYTTLYNITTEECDHLAKILEKHATQISNLWLHLPDANKNMLGFRYTAEYEYVLTRIKQLKNVPVFEMTMDNNSKIDASIKTKTNPASWYLHTRANNLDIENIKEQSINMPPRYEYIVECTRHNEYHANVLLPNGDVILCCMDYGLKHKLGNLLIQSYDEILNGIELQQLSELNNQLGFSKKTLCKSCNDAFCHTPWNNKKVWEMVALVDPDSLGI